MLFDTSNHRTYEKVTQNGLEWGPKIHPKSMKIYPGTLQGPPECICAPPDDQNGAKMVPKDIQMDPKWPSGDQKNK